MKTLFATVARWWTNEADMEPHTARTMVWTLMPAAAVALVILVLLP